VKISCLWRHRWVLIESSAAAHSYSCHSWVPLAVLQCSRCGKRQVRTIHAGHCDASRLLPASRDQALAWCRGQAASAFPDSLPNHLSSKVTP
jgi:hypothetical protein